MKKTFTLRALVFWSHLGIGLTTGMVVLVLSLTGALLAFERPILSASDRHAMETITPTAQEHPLAELMVRTEALAGQKVTAIRLSADATQAIILEAGRDNVYLANPYSGEVKGPASAGLRAFFTQVTGLHRWFGLAGASRKTAMVVKGWFTLAFVLLIVSGWLLWLPARWTPQALRVRLRPGWAATARAREFNWHHSLGIWLSIPLLVISVTGVIMALPWANALLFRATGSPLPVQQARGSEQGGERAGARSQHSESKHPESKRPENKRPESNESKHSEEQHKQAGKEDRPQVNTNYDQILTAARLASGTWKTLQLRIPEAGARTVQVVADHGNGAQPEKRTTLIFRSNGQLDHVEKPAGQSLGKRARAYVRFLHTGEVYGLLGEAIGFLACLVGMMLVYTGIALSLRRFSRNR